MEDEITQLVILAQCISGVMLRKRVVSHICWVCLGEAFRPWGDTEVLEMKQVDLGVKSIMSSSEALG